VLHLLLDSSTIAEILFETGFYAVLHIRKKRTERNPIVAAIGYFITGAAIGGISLILFPNSLIPSQLKLPNLIITPIIIGILMGLLGKWRLRKGQEIIRIDRFFYGFIFALSMAFIRYKWVI
jgi:hypothetical protein